MTNSEKYHFADFTRENYRRFLRLARKNYIFRTYTDFIKNERFIIWRHDVDFSMHSALKMAQIENEEGTIATYFLLLHSEFYNLLEQEITELVKKIIYLGHNIGLHFDCSYYQIKDTKMLEKFLIQEKRILEDNFGQEISSFSFHTTTSFAADCREWQYAGLINTFSDYFRTDVGFCSDSNGYWRYRRLEDILKENKEKRLQVLTHPELWQKTIMSPKQRVYRCIDGRAEKTRKWYDNILQEYGRENVDWD